MQRYSSSESFCNSAFSLHCYNMRNHSCFEFHHFLHQPYFTINHTILNRLPTLSVRFTTMHFMGWKKIGEKLLNSTTLQQNKVRSYNSSMTIFEFVNFCLI